MPWETPRECLLSDRLGQKKERKQGRRRGRESRKWYKDTKKGEYWKSHTDQWDVRSYVSATLMRQQDVKVNKLVFLFLPLFLRILGRVLECNCFLPICPPLWGLANHSIRLYFTPFTLANLSLPLDWFAAFFLSPPLKQQHTDIHSPSTPGHSIGRKEGVTLVHRSGNAFSCFVHYPKSNMFSLPFSFSLKN